MHRSTRAVALGAILALALAAPVAAADIPETLTVNSTMSVSGLPASINYGTVDAGAATAAQTVTATIAANVTWTVKIGGSRLLRYRDARLRSPVQITVVSGPAGIGTGADSWHDFGTLNFRDGVSNPASGLCGRYVRAHNGSPGQCPRRRRRWRAHRDRDLHLHRRQLVP